MDYSKWKVKELKDELRRRGAKLGGRKGELIDRLQSYDRNNDFGYQEPEEVEKMTVPDKLLYRDINADSVIPFVDQQIVLDYLFQYNIQKVQESAVNMYKEKFLMYIQCKDSFIKGCVRAEMRKSVQYQVDIKMENDSVGECQCECAVGSWPSAHCKHVVIVLLALVDFHKKKEIITYQTCTEKIQTFHQPKKRHTASPVPCERMSKKTRNVVNPVPDQKYTNKVLQKMINFCSLKNENMAFTQMLKPAHPVAAEVDHDYLINSESDQLLLDLKLKGIKEEDIKKIEEATRGQANNEEWKKMRRYRVTASKAGTACKHPDRPSLISQLLLPSKELKARAITHGIKYESVAVKAYEDRSKNNTTECGLFLDVKKPYLGGSPDRLVSDHITVEVKCPYTPRNRKISPETVPYLELTNIKELEIKGNSDRFDDPTVTLKKDHDYYYQVQLQMYLTGRIYCHFVVYTFQDLKIIIIERDEDFIQKMLLELEDFYEKKLKPAIINKFIVRNFYQFKSFAKSL